MAASQAAPSGNAERLRGALGLVFGELVRAGTRFVEHPDLRERYPEYLVMCHTVIRASVPLMEATRERARELAAADDEVAGELVDYYAEHIEEERDHDEWLLQDLEAIGVPRDEVLPRPPSPTVAAVVGAQYYWALHFHPCALLAWTGLLEGYAPAPAMIDGLQERTGYPPEAFRTLRLHAELDVAHGDELFALVDRLPLSEEQATVIGMNAMTSVHALARALDEVTGATPAEGPSRRSAR
jgi:pyrroloquinoline quinone (PQQ) biosynthesis protein C